MSRLEITVDAAASGPLMRLSGETDLGTAGQLRDALASQLSVGQRHLTVDISGLQFADSASIQVLLQADRTLKKRGGGLELAGPQPRVAQVLRMLGVDQMLTIRPDTSSGTGGDGSLRPG